MFPPWDCVLSACNSGTKSEMVGSVCGWQICTAEETFLFPVSGSFLSWAFFLCFFLRLLLEGGLGSGETQVLTGGVHVGVIFTLCRFPWVLFSGLSLTESVLSELGEIRLLWLSIDLDMFTPFSVFVRRITIGVEFTDG